MHTVAARLSNHIKRTATGPMWHGAALGELLNGVTHADAAARPIAGAHSIWEIVLHIAAWAEIVRARVRGERTRDPLPQEDWPPILDATAEHWQKAVDRLQASYRELATDVRRLPEESIQATVPGLDYTNAVQLHGVIEHGSYHGGQIALLKRLLAIGRQTQSGSEPASQSR